MGSTRPKHENVVLTGCGWVTPFASGSVDDVLTAAKTASADLPDGTAYWAIPDDVVEQCADFSKELRSDKASWITALAVRCALTDAALDLTKTPSERVGLVVGCALAGQHGMITFADEVRTQSARFVSPIHFPQTVGNYVAGALSRGFNIRGANQTLAAGDASGIEAILEGAQLLRSGRVDVVLAGGTEQWSEQLAIGFSQPNQRLGEGACMFVMEREDHAVNRNARVLGRLTGESEEYALSSTAGFRVPGAVFIEHWIGRCMGAGGAAALAAAIGAVNGMTVPIVDPQDDQAIAVQAVPATNTNDPARKIRIDAGDDLENKSTLTLVCT